jgi:hypothetical protein
VLNYLVEVVFILITTKQSDCDSALFEVAVSNFCNSAQVSFSVAALLVISVAKDRNVIVDYDFNISEIDTS